MIKVKVPVLTGSNYTGVQEGCIHAVSSTYLLQASKLRLKCKLDIPPSEELRLSMDGSRHFRVVYLGLS